MNPYRSSSRSEPEPESKQSTPTRRRIPFDFLDTVRRRWPDVDVTQITRLDGSFSWFLRLHGETGNVDYAPDGPAWPWPLKAISAEIKRMRAVVDQYSIPLWSGRLRILRSRH